MNAHRISFQELRFVSEVVRRQPPLITHVHTHANTIMYLHVGACVVSLWVTHGLHIARLSPRRESHVHGRAGAMAHWPALQRWADPAYLLAAAGPRTVPVELGAHYLAPGWGQALMPFSAFVAAHLLADPGPAAAKGAATSAKLGGRGKAQAGAASAAAAGRLCAQSERTGCPAGAAAGSGLGAAAAQCGGGAATAPGGAAQRGYLAQHDLFAQVRATPCPGAACDCAGHRQPDDHSKEV